MASFFYNNLLRSATVVSEDTISNFGFSNALSGRTSDQVGMSSGANRDIVVDFGSALTFNHVCVASHNLNGTTLTVAGSADNVSYTDIDSIAYDNNYVRCDEIDEATYRYVRFRFSGHAADIYIADLFLGTPLDLLYGVPAGFTPPEQADDDELDAHMTGSGALVGITVHTKPKEVRLTLADYPASWFETYWLDFAASMKLYPAYFLWATGKRAMYFTLDRRIGKPEFSTNTRQTLSLTMNGFVE